MTVKDMLITKCPTVTVDMRLDQIEQVLQASSLHVLPVLNEYQKIVGIISETELYTADYKLHFPTYVRVLMNTSIFGKDAEKLPYVAKQIFRLTARDVMNRRVLFARPNMDLDKLTSLFTEQQATCLPVADNSNMLVGMVTEKDLLRLLAGKLPRQKTDYLKRPESTVDRAVTYTYNDLRSRFYMVTKARANVWLTTAITIFIVGFILGIAYIADLSFFDFLP